MSLDPELIGPLLVRGSRADVHEWGENAQEARVVKIYRGADSRRSALALGAALGVTNHPHLLRLEGLVGVGTSGKGDVGVVLPRLSTRTAAEWLRARRVISAGESVTLLVPILLALLHVERRRLDARVRLSAAVGLDDILFDARGAAVVTGVRVVPAGDGPTPADVASRLVAEVLAATVGGSASARATLVALFGQGASIDELLEVLFEFDEPAPLEEPSGELPALVVEAAEPARAPTPHLLDDFVPGLQAVRSAAAGAVAAAEASPRLAPVLGGLREVRPRVWAGAGVLGVSAVVGLSVLSGPAPAGGGAEASALGPGAVSAASAASAAAAGPSGAADTPGAASAAVGGPGGSAPLSGPSTAAAGLAAVLTGNDADGAARELLRLRADCLSALDAECLTAVVQPGSPLLVRDLASIDDPAGLADRPVALRVTEVVNRLGGAVLYRARAPDNKVYSVLVTRTEAGWRLRTIA